jgi:hypothetical protein
MNFIGHAHVAAARSSDPAFVFGAMLPDFLSMARIRGARSDDPAVTHGIAFHHASDEAFHRGATFIRLSSNLGDALERRGVRRGPSRAVAHVGIELLIDGFLLDTKGLSDAYLAAIAQSAPNRLGGRLRFAKPEHHGRYAELVTRLAAWGVPDGYGDPVIVGERLVRILRDRPRLALTPEEAETVGGLLPEAKDAVGRNLEALVALVRKATEALPIG